MKIQPDSFTLGFRMLLVAAVFTFLGCSNNPTDSSDENSTETDTDTNQTSALDDAYPLDFCLVSGSDFGEDPDMIPYTHVHEGTVIKFCCKPCLPRFEKDPEKYLTDLKEEIEALEKEAKQ